MPVRKAWFIGASILALLVAFAICRTAAAKPGWMDQHPVELLAAGASTAALGFVAYAAMIQARQARSQELLTSFQLARPDLAALSRQIAITARLVVIERKDGAPGKLPEYQGAYEIGDHTIFAHLITHPERIEECLKGSEGKKLRHQINRYVYLFDSLTALTRERELEHMLLRLPLGRAYCTLKVAINQDADGRLAKYLKFDLGAEAA